MRDKVLFGLFVVLAFSVGFVLGGVGKSDTDGSSHATENASEQVLASVNKVLEPFLADYEQRYDTLNAEHDKVQADLEIAERELATIKASGETVSLLRDQVSRQQAEIGSLKASLQNALNDSTSWQQKFLQSQHEVGETQRLLVDAQAEYGEIYGKLSVVDSHESDTVNGFTAEEKATFYKVWDEWWDLVVEGTD